LVRFGISGHDTSVIAARDDTASAPLRRAATPDVAVVARYNRQAHAPGLRPQDARNRTQLRNEQGTQVVSRGGQHDSHPRAQPAAADRLPTEDLLTPKPIPPAQRKPVNANANPDLVRQFEETADRLGLTKDEALDRVLTQWIAANR
jgi:hypothetical protein